MLTTKRLDRKWRIPRINAKVFLNGNITNHQRIWHTNRKSRKPKLWSSNATKPLTKIHEQGDENGRSRRISLRCIMPRRGICCGQHMVPGYDAPIRSSWEVHRSKPPNNRTNALVQSIIQEQTKGVAMIHLFYRTAGCVGDETSKSLCWLWTIRIFHASPGCPLSIQHMISDWAVVDFHWKSTTAQSVLK